MKIFQLHIKNIIPALAAIILLITCNLQSLSQVNTFFIKGATTHSIEISFVNEEIDISRGDQGDGTGPLRRHEPVPQGGAQPGVPRRGGTLSRFRPG